MADSTAPPPIPDAVPVDPALAVLAHCRLRIARVFPRQIHAAVESLDDAQLWWRPNPHANSVGALVRHLSGNVRALVGRGIGGSGYVRDREGEFAGPPLPRAELLAELDAAIAERDNIILARQEKGEALWKLGRKEEAIAVWSEAVARNPGLALTQNELAGAKRALGRAEEAAAHEQQADQATPSDPLYHFMLGLRLANLGMQEMAEKHFAHAAQLDPNYRTRRPN